ncbi:MAG: hypothetical protein JRI28_02630 [Deltaproteobacteria bacterium]|nr:hypothetical protein [Deltaproteobacteria bacterium]
MGKNLNEWEFITAFYLRQGDPPNASSIEKRKARDPEFAREEAGLFIYRRPFQNGG